MPRNRGRASHPAFRRDLTQRPSYRFVSRLPVMNDRVGEGICRIGGSTSLRSYTIVVGVVPSFDILRLKWMSH
jgi:hypothetical protein